MHRKALGRGLEALIPGASSVGSSAIATVDPRTEAGGLQEVAIGEIAPNPYQPRTRFDDEAIRELAASIRANGVLQPVILRKATQGEYQLVAGERRIRAAQVAGLTTIPAVVRDVSDRELMEMALVENIQRENLNPIEEARAYQTLAEKLGMTHDQISERVGKQRVSITN